MVRVGWIVVRLSVLVGVLALASGCAMARMPDYGIPMFERTQSVLPSETSTIAVGHVEFCLEGEPDCARTTERVVLGDAPVAEVMIDSTYARSCSEYSEQVEARVDDGAWVPLHAMFRGGGFCGVGAPTQIRVEEGERRELPTFIPTRPLDLSTELDTPAMRFAAGMLPQLHMGRNNLQVRYSLRCGDDSPIVPVAVGALDVVVPSEANLLNYRQLVSPRKSEIHPRSRELAQSIHDLGAWGSHAKIVLVNDERPRRKGLRLRHFQEISYITRSEREGRCSATRWTLVEDRLGSLVVARETFQRTSPFVIPCDTKAVHQSSGLRIASSKSSHGVGNSRVHPPF